MNDLAASINLSRSIEVSASLLSCFGAHFVAKYGVSSRALLGWSAWLLAGALWITFSAMNSFWFMACTQTYFFYTAAKGLQNTRKATAS